jgi:hypothetical protein
MGYLGLGLSLFPWLIPFKYTPSGMLPHLDQAYH